MTMNLLPAPEGTFWRIAGPQHDLTLLLVRKDNNEIELQHEITQDHGYGSIRSAIEAAQRGIFDMLMDRNALKSIKEEFLAQEEDA